MAKDFGIDLTRTVSLRVDSTAGIGVSSRRGAGRIRHIHTPALWLQSAVHDGRIAMSKVLGTENPANLGTKHVSAGEIHATWKKIGFVLLEGRSQKTLKAQLED